MKGETKQRTLPIVIKVLVASILGVGAMACTLQFIAYSIEQKFRPALLAPAALILGIAFWAIVDGIEARND